MTRVSPCHILQYVLLIVPRGTLKKPFRPLFIGLKRTTARKLPMKKSGKKWQFPIAYAVEIFKVRDVRNHANYDAEYDLEYFLKELKNIHTKLKM